MSDARMPQSAFYQPLKNFNYSSKYSRNLKYVYIYISQ